MLIPVTKEPVPYILAYDRDRSPQTLFNLVPMTGEESALYRARWNKEKDEYNVPMVLKTRNALRVDREALLGQLASAENVFTEGDKIEGEDLVKLVNESLDFVTVQELMMAVQSMSLLEAGRKKS